MLRTFGATNVRLMNGTQAKWEAEGRPLEKGDVPSAWKYKRATKPKADDFDFRINKARIAYYDEMVKLSEENKERIVPIPIIDSRFK